MGTTGFWRTGGLYYRSTERGDPQMTSFQSRLLQNALNKRKQKKNGFTKWN